MIVDEVGPWRVERGATVTTRGTVRLTASTRYDLFMHVDAPGAFAGDFIEVALDVNDLVPGDFVTRRECVRDGARLGVLAVMVGEVR